MSGRLQVVATPIGNLEDVTLRALRVLREADAILAEDTRRTRALCAHHGIATPLRAFHAHSADALIAALVDELAGGAKLALVTDAGTPLVSDPGAALVAAAAARGVSVEPIPGPSAPLAALVASGLRVGAFRFLGFLPRSGAKRRVAIEGIARAVEASVLFEAANRLPETLAELAGVMPERPAAVARELTKLHEEIARGTLAALAARYAEAPRGEVTLVIEGAPEPEHAPPDEEVIVRQARALLDEGLRTKAVARDLAAAHAIPLRDAYALVLRAAGRA
ncbi:MAG: 16S rRNA (cytidine(1402)-2'-O)-methyltransferase [Sandaracinaceae bacterium]|nr:16S rRNA (cytidine(1402)-2'-O)-methyltransferase [Sandaracinaceae bacterium]